MKDSLTAEIVSFLKESKFFASLEETYLEQIAKRFEMFQIQAGETLIREGDPGDSIYLILSGRMRAVKKIKDEIIILNESGRGELIGELALLTEETRASTVIAVRDSLLLKLAKADFTQFIHANPQEIFPIVKSTNLRILQPQKKSSHGHQIIAFTPAGLHCPLFKEFVNEFTLEIAKTAKTLHLNHSRMNEHLKKADIQNNTGNIIQWLNDQEMK